MGPGNRSSVTVHSTTTIGDVDQWHKAPDRDGVKTIRLNMKDGTIYKNTL